MMRLESIRRLTYAALGALALLLTAAPADAQRRIPVNVESTPAGATVYLDTTDGQPLGVTPLRFVRIPRGQHRLIFRLENHREASLTVDVRRRRETFRTTLEPIGHIDVVSGNTDTDGAAVRINGRPVGNVPHQETVEPGRYLVQVGREGYVTFSQWVDVAGGQTRTIPVSLEREAPRTGELLVAGDITGASVLVDGTPRGQTPAVIDGLVEGEHTVEVQAPADMQGVDPFRQTVTIRAGERTVLAPAMRPSAPTHGSIRVIVNVPGAVVSVDGEVLGEAPATADELVPGEHIVEARLDGYEPAQEPVNIESGQRRVVSITLQAVNLPAGRLVVNANVDGASVIIDNGEPRSAPVVIEEPSVGAHAIVVRREGYQEFRTTCTVAPGQNCEVQATLAPVETPVRILANVRDAELLVDDEILGPVPWEGTLPVGPHRFEIRAEGYRPFRAQLALRHQRQTRELRAELVAEGEMTPEEIANAEARRVERHRQAVARSGATLPTDLAVLDMSLGNPYYVELRLGIGILEWLEAGIGIRSNFHRLTEFEGRVKAGWRPIEQISLGAQIRGGGGLGPSYSGSDFEYTFDPDGAGGPMLSMEDQGLERPSYDTNTGFFSLEGMFSLHFLRAGNFTLWVGMDVHSDSWPWRGDDLGCRYTAGCDDTAAVAGTPREDMAGDRQLETYDGRQTTVRMRLGGSLEFILNESWNLWGSFEGILLGNRRRINGDLWGLGNEEVPFYGRLGFTYKFGFRDYDEPPIPPTVEPGTEGEPEAEPAPAPAEPAPAEAEAGLMPVAAWF